MFDHDFLVTCVVEDVSAYQDIPTLEFWAMLERPPFIFGCKRTLRRLPVLHNRGSCSDIHHCCRRL